MTQAPECGADALRAAADGFPERLSEILADSDERRRAADLRALLVQQVCAPVQRATALPELSPAALAALGALADAVRGALPQGAEQALGVRPRVLLRLLLRGDAALAWEVAAENASGTVQERWIWATPAGAARTSVRLPLTTVVEDGRVFAWLPGFRDPRAGVPDDVYDITDKVVLRAALEDARVDGDALLLSGRAHLAELTADDGEVVTVLLSRRGGGGRTVRVRAERVRRPDLVRTTGPELSRLARAGWRVRLQLPELGPDDGVWQGELEVRRDGLVRRTPLGRDAGPLLAAALGGPAVETAGRSYRLQLAERRLVLRVATLSLRARLVPQPVRADARRLLRRPER